LLGRGAERCPWVEVAGRISKAAGKKEGGAHPSGPLRMLVAAVKGRGHRVVSGARIPLQTNSPDCPFDAGARTSRPRILSKKPGKALLGRSTKPGERGSSRGGKGGRRAPGRVAPPPPWIRPKPPAGRQTARFKEWGNRSIFSGRVLGMQGIRPGGMTRPVRGVGLVSIAEGNFVAERAVQEGRRDEWQSTSTMSNRMGVPHPGSMTGTGLKHDSWRRRGRSSETIP